MTLFSHLQTIARRFARPYRPDAMALMDLGLTRSEFDILQSSRPETREQMVAMAGKFGVSPQMLGRSHWQELDAALACAQCGHARDCLKYLGGVGEFSVEDCPNAGLYRELAA